MAQGNVSKRLFKLIYSLKLLPLHPVCLYLVIPIFQYGRIKQGSLLGSPGHSSSFSMHIFTVFMVNLPTWCYIKNFTQSVTSLFQTSVNLPYYPVIFLHFCKERKHSVQDSFTTRQNFSQVLRIESTDRHQIKCNSKHELGLSNH